MKRTASIFAALAAAILGGAFAAAAGDKSGGRAPAIKGAEVVLRGFKSNAAGVRVEFQVEKLAGAGELGDEYYGVIFEPWNADNPVVVAQAGDRKDAAEATSVFISTDSHGLP